MNPIFIKYYCFRQLWVALDSFGQFCSAEAISRELWAALVSSWYLWVLLGGQRAVYILGRSAWLCILLASQRGFPSQSFTFAVIGSY